MSDQERFLSWASDLTFAYFKEDSDTPEADLEELGLDAVERAYAAGAEDMRERVKGWSDDLDVAVTHHDAEDVVRGVLAVMESMDAMPTVEDKNDNK